MLPNKPYKSSCKNYHLNFQRSARSPQINQPGIYYLRKINAETLVAHRTTDARTQAALPKNLSSPRRAPYLVEDEALALARAAADGDDPDGALDKLQRRHRLGVHHELALLVAVRQAQRARGTRGRAAVPAHGGGRVAGAGAGAPPAEAQHLQHREVAADGKGSVSLCFLLSKMGRGKREISQSGGIANALSLEGG